MGNKLPTGRVEYFTILLLLHLFLNCSLGFHLNGYAFFRREFEMYIHANEPKFLDALTSINMTLLIL